MQSNNLRQINYIQDLYFDHQFTRVEKEVWMLDTEKIIANVRLSKKSKTYGFIARRQSKRTNFLINKPKKTAFYLSEEAVDQKSFGEISDPNHYQNRKKTLI